MGLFDLFRHSASDPHDGPAAMPPEERRFTLDRARMFDIEKTRRLAQLFAVARDRRDDAWYDLFWDAAWPGSIALAEPQVFSGPDGFPYLRLDLPRPHAPFDSQCLANLAGHCLSTGIGAAFFASPDDPPEAAQYVLSLGLIDSLVRYDSSEGDPVDRHEAALPPDPSAYSVEQRGIGQRLTVQETRNVLIGAPSAEYLPPDIARALDRHLREQWGLESPRVALLVDTGMRPHRSLVIGRKRSTFADQAEMDALVHFLIWYLTPLRTVMPMPDDWNLDEMTPLRDLCGSR
jgi:hypothetical protein